VPRGVAHLRARPGASRRANEAKHLKRREFSAKTTWQ